MRRFWTALCALIMLLLLAAPLWAQEATPVPATPTPASADPLATVQALATAVALDVANGITAADAATDRAFNLLGIFEAIGFLVTVVAGAAGAVGVFQLFSARADLQKTREQLVHEAQELRQRFESEIKGREEELRKLERQLETFALEQSEYTSRALLANALIPLGERQYKTGDYVGALNTYLRALELAPDNPVVNQRLGYVYTQRGDLDAARRHYEAAIGRENNFAPGLAGLGFVFRRQGEKLDKLVHSAPDETQRLQRILERDLLFNQAEEHLLKALKISPRLVDDDGESWWGVVGGLYKRRGQIDQAIEAYHQVTQVTPESSYGFGNLALLYIKKNDRARMLKTYERVEKIAETESVAEAGNFWGYADLIVSRFALGKAQAAREMMPMAITLAPEDSPYMLEALMETLAELLTVLQDERRPAIEQAVAELRHELHQRQQKRLVPESLP
ncbi:MAG: tetratricopeptide repeat protein [Anaerolineae bacterium]|jgi:tetratricopeptide (TPR) repeat protein|nr:tetratricopeptide repeat protein [Anaerolineae bacterium]